MLHIGTALTPPSTIPQKTDCVSACGVVGLTKHTECYALQSCRKYSGPRLSSRDTGGVANRSSTVFVQQIVAR